jgi:hypothetical protein
MSKIKELRIEATKWIEKNKSPVWRSCWVCNPAHDHLKNVNYPIECFSCGHYYYKGVNITITDKEERLEKLKELNKSMKDGENKLV